MSLSLTLPQKLISRFLVLFICFRQQYRMFPLIKLLLCSLFCYYACKYIALFYFHKTIYHFFLCFLKKSQKYTLFLVHNVSTTLYIGQCKCKIAVLLQNVRKHPVLLKSYTGIAKPKLHIERKRIEQILDILSQRNNKVSLTN